MQKIVFLFLLFFSATSLAQVEIYFFNPQIRWEADPHYELTQTESFTFGAGYRFNQKYFLSTEYLETNSSSGNSTLSVQHQHQELTLWGKYFYNNWVYGTLGTGLFQEKVDTSLYEHSNSMRSSTYSLLGAGVGLQTALLTTSKSTGFTVGIEGRMLYSEYLPQSTLYALLVKFAISFGINSTFFE